MMHVVHNDWENKYRKSIQVGEMTRYSETRIVLMPQNDRGKVQNKGSGQRYRRRCYRRHDGAFVARDMESFL